MQGLKSASEMNTATFWILDCPANGPSSFNSAVIENLEGKIVTCNLCKDNRQEVELVVVVMREVAAKELCSDSC